MTRKPPLFRPAPTSAERSIKPKAAVEAISAPASAFLEDATIDDTRDTPKGNLKAIYAPPKIHPLNL